MMGGPMLSLMARIKIMIRWNATRPVTNWLKAVRKNDPPASYSGASLYARLCLLTR